MCIHVVLCKARLLLPIIECRRRVPMIFKPLLSERERPVQVKFLHQSDSYHDFLAVGFDNAYRITVTREGLSHILSQVHPARAWRRTTTKNRLFCTIYL